jgi:FecR protein
MNIQTPVILTIASLAISLSNGVRAEELREAKVTQVIQDVKLLPAGAAPQPATINADVRHGTAVQTGVQSRSELTFKDKTITRLGEKTIFSVGEGGRTIDLGSGQFLLYVPKKSGGAKIKMGPVTAAITGTTVLGNYDPSGVTTFVVLEGGACITLDRMGQSVYVGAGQQLTYDPITGRLGDPADVDLNQVVTSPLIKDFRQLPSAPLIEANMRARHAGAVGGPGAVEPGELEAAVRAAGASSISTATDEQFMHALNSVFVRTGDVCSYVALAVRARPDLAARIAVAAIGVHQIGRGYAKDFKDYKGKEISCDEANCIVQAAMAADPFHATEIVDAVIAAAPFLRDCITAPCGHNAFQQPRIITPITPPIPPVVSPEQPTQSSDE